MTNHISSQFFRIGLILSHIVISDTEEHTQSLLDNLDHKFADGVLQSKILDLESRYRALKEQLDIALIDKENLYMKLTTVQEELLDISRANTVLRMSLMSLDPASGRFESELKSWVIDLQQRVESQREQIYKDKEVSAFYFALVYFTNIHLVY